MSDYLAVMGNPIKHSLSPVIHPLFAEQFNIRIDYKRILVPEDGFAKAIDSFRLQGGKGLSITLPFKNQAFNLMPKHSERAALAQAISVAVIKDGEYYGDNLDGVGLVRDLTVNINVIIQDKAIVILGAGGAVQGVLEPLLAQQPRVVYIANRTVAKAQKLADTFKTYGNVQACSYDDLPQHSFDIVINGTSASIQGVLPPLPTSLVTKQTCCYDMMYGKKTVFMQWAEGLGVQQVHDGLGMLVEQGAESFALWYGQRPNTNPIYRILSQQRLC